MKKTLMSCLVVGALGLSGSAFGCSLAAWSDTNGGALEGGPGEANDIARYSGLCSMSTGAAADYVQDNSPAGASETRLRARFYVLADGGSGTIFEAFSDEAGGASEFSVALNGGNIEFDAGGDTLSAPAGTGWNSVEFDWDSASGASSLWVNSDAATDAADDTGTASGAGIDSVRLGGSGFIFDAYEARRTTAIGRLVAGDANGNGSISIADAVGVLNELNGNFQSGQPDCNESGGMSIADAVCVLNLL